MLANLAILPYICEKNNAMLSQSSSQMPLAVNHISVDCVVLGFDGEKLRVLLIKRVGEENGQVFHDMKLPGGLIFTDENLDDAARRVLRELTGIKSINLLQFKAYGSKDRTKNAKDVHWLERAIQMKVDRIVTIAYIALVRINRGLTNSSGENEICWVPLDEVKTLAFDHNIILADAIDVVRRHAEADPSYLFNLLPQKFTILQLRTLYERVYGKPQDVRNFQKKVNQLDYVVALDEHEQGVAHRAARLYRFDRKLFKRVRR